MQKTHSLTKLHLPLLGLDLLVLVAFSYGGVQFHYIGGSAVAQVLRIIWPFLVAFLLVGLPLGAYRRPRSGKRFASKTGILWLFGMGSGFVLRGLASGHSPSTIFVKIALAFTGVGMLVVRGCYWLITSHRAAGRTP